MHSLLILLLTDVDNKLRVVDAIATDSATVTRLPPKEREADSEAKDHQM